MQLRSWVAANRVSTFEIASPHVYCINATTLAVIWNFLQSNFHSYLHRLRYAHSNNWNKLNKIFRTWKLFEWTVTILSKAIQIQAFQKTPKSCSIELFILFTNAIFINGWMNESTFTVDNKYHYDYECWWVFDTHSMNLIILKSKYVADTHSVLIA